MLRAYKKVGLGSLRKVLWVQAVPGARVYSVQNLLGGVGRLWLRARGKHH